MTLVNQLLNLLILLKTLLLIKIKSYQNNSLKWIRDKTLKFVFLFFIIITKSDMNQIEENNLSYSNEK